MFDHLSESIFKVVFLFLSDSSIKCLEHVLYEIPKIIIVLDLMPEDLLTDL